MKEYKLKKEIKRIGLMYDIDLSNDLIDKLYQFFNNKILDIVVEYSQRIEKANIKIHQNIYKEIQSQFEEKKK
jgi:hypothetical protein